MGSPESCPPSLAPAGTSVAAPQSHNRAASQSPIPNSTTNLADASQRTTEELLVRACLRCQEEAESLRVVEGMAGMGLQRRKEEGL